MGSPRKRLRVWIVDHVERGEMKSTLLTRKRGGLDDQRIGAPLLSIENGAGTPVAVDLQGKRLVDLLLSGSMVLLTAPLWALIALAVKLEDGGPVFYEQVRYGRGGSCFRVKKFRSMVAGFDQVHDIHQAKEDDSRITRIGSILRRFGLDELPQILAIWKGDMSFVGPRPLAVGEIVAGEDGERVAWESMTGFAERLSVRPGLTSLATIYLPKDVHPERKFQLDMLYMRQRRLTLDLRLILLSLVISFKGRWESRQGKV